MAFDFGEEQIRSLGAFLRKTREERELSLEDVAVATKIHVRFLAAIEEDDPEALPDHSYRDLFIRSYADFLDISIEQVMLRLPESRKKSEGAKEKPAPKKEEAATLKATTPPPVRRLPVRPLVFAGAIIVLAVVVVLLVFGGNGEEMLSEPTAADSTYLQAIVPPVPVSESYAPESLYLLLVGHRDCWLNVRVDGDSVFAATIGMMDTVRFSLQDSVYFKLGRANGVDAWLNGLPLFLGRETDSATAEYFLTQENYQGFVDSTRLVQ